MTDKAKGLSEENRRRTCSCLEVYGEDPNCFKHGRGSEWSKANPDICELLDQLQSAQAENTKLSERVKAVETWLREPDHAENWSLGDMLAWAERRPVSALLSNQPEETGR